MIAKFTFCSGHLSLIIDKYLELLWRYSLTHGIMPMKNLKAS